MRISTLVSALLGLSLAPAALAPATTAPGGSPAVRMEAALAAGAACLVKDFDGAGFRDPYLAYVYPHENLPVPAPRARLTYRMVDADVVLVLLGRSGNVPGNLGPAVRQADDVLRSVLPLWGRSGIYNTRKNARAGGVALDTFCIVGWLYQDAAMAQAAMETLDGDGWLPAGYYEGDERFRRDADEAWCLRLLASPVGRGLDAAPAVLDRIAATLRDATATDPGGRGTFYQAWHLAMVLAEAEASSRGLPSRHAPLRQEVMAAFTGWAAARGEPSAGKDPDVFEWANLASADLPRVPQAAALRERGVEAILRSQDDDGCVGIAGAQPPGMARDFLTLRALLALALHLPPVRGGGVPASDP